MRGVHESTDSTSPATLGSSPHARGPRHTCFSSAVGAGIIPACAGSTPYFRFNLHSIQDHPRMRGVHPEVKVTSNGKTGSSPHARGPPEQRIESVGKSRIIPACAGSTRAEWGMAGHRRDHPRMRGVHAVVQAGRRGFQGSSPHARGPLDCFMGSGSTGGIIPACAGSTFVKRSQVAPQWDHPRMRGVHRFRCRAEPPSRGSSPHARGPLL